MRTSTILVVEDEVDMLKGLTKMLSRVGYSVEGASNGTEAIEKIEKRVYNVVVTDLKLPGPSGIEILRRLKETSPESEGIVITGYGTVETAVEAMKLGAYDFITKPFDMQKVRIAVRNALEQANLISENRYLKQRLNTDWQVKRIVSASTAMKRVLEDVEHVASTDATCLLIGESGTGKELIARLIHHTSPHRENLFMPINCAVTGKNPLDSELFGYVMGAFSGAGAAKRGLLEIAHGGTCFLDEIADANLEVQRKLLQVFEDGTFIRLGSTEKVCADVRLIATTSRDLEERVRAGAFSEELYRRLRIASIHIPPLRERTDDIPLLAQLFLERHARRLGKPVTVIAPAAMEALVAHPWPGNVRELANAVERGLILAGGDTLALDDLPTRIAGPAKPLVPPGSYEAARSAVLARFTNDYCSHLLTAHHGNMSLAAREAGMDEAAFRQLFDSAHHHDEDT